MILFHGTRATRRQLASIFREGLRAFPRGWLHELGAEDEHCFLANQPVAGVGGDPVFFAMSDRGLRLGAETDGWIVVVELPPDARDVVRAVIPNLDLEQYFTDQPLRAALLWPARPGRLAAVPSVLEALVAIARDESAIVRLASTAAREISRLDTISGDVSYATWCRYAEAIATAPSLDRIERIGRRFGVTWRDPELLHCMLCAHGMMTWAYPLPDGLDLDGAGRGSLPAVLHGRPISAGDWSMLARRVSGWVGDVTTAQLREAVAALPPTARWRDALPRLPIDASRVPAPWRSDFGRTFGAEDLRRADVQLACAALAPEHVRGALRVVRGKRFLPWVRPGRGTTLTSKLWKAAHVVLDRYRGTPIVYEGD